MSKRHWRLCQCGKPHRYVFVCDEHGLRIIIEGDQDLQRGMLPLFDTHGLDPDTLMEACNEVAGVNEQEGLDILRRAGILLPQ